MNKLKTVAEVSRVTEGKIAIIDQIVVGELTTNKVIKTQGIEVGFRYSKEDGTLLESGGKTYTWEQVNALYDLIKAGVPDTTFEDLLNYAFLEAFKLEMANTFSITTSDIEEVV